MIKENPHTYEIVKQVMYFVIPTMKNKHWLDEAQLLGEVSKWDEEAKISTSIEEYDAQHQVQMEIFVEKHISTLNRAQKMEIFWMIWAWKHALYERTQKRAGGKFAPIPRQERGETPLKYTRQIIPLPHHVLAETRKIKQFGANRPEIKAAWEAALKGEQTVASVNRMVKDLEKKWYDDKSEQIIETKFAYAFRDYGMKNVQRQVPLPSGGVVDLLMENMICEFKHRLTRNHIYKAVGQLLLYAAELERQNDRLVIIGYPTWEAKKLEPFVKRLGIEIVFHEDEPEQEDIT